MEKVSNKFLGEAMDTPELVTKSPEVKPSEKFVYDINGFDTFKRAFKNDSLLSIASEKIEQHENDNKYDIDENFDAKNVWNEELEKAIHPDFKDSMMNRAKSEEHFNSMIDYYKEQSAIQRELESYGFMKSIGYGLLPEVTNAPIYFGAVALLPETAMMMGSTALLRFATSGSAGMAIEGLKDVLGEQDKGALDYAGAMIFDGALGSAIGKRTNTFNNLANDMVLRTHGITSAVMAKVKKANSKEEKNIIISNAYNKHSGEQADKTLLDVLDANIEYANQNIVQKAWGSVRQDIAYVTGNSKSSTMSDFSRKMFPDATLQNLDLNNPDMASARDLLEGTMRAKRQDIFQPLIKRYTKLVHGSKGIMWIKPSGQMEREFGNIIGEIQLHRNIYGTDVESAIVKVLNRRKIDKSDDIMKLFRDSAKGMEDLSIGYHDMLGKAGHDEFLSGAIPKDATYMPFVYNKESLAPLLNKGVRQYHIKNFFKAALKKNMGDIDDEILNVISDAFYNAVSAENIKKLNTFDSILDEIASSTKYSDEVKEVIEQIKKKKYDRSGDDLANSSNARTNIDYKHKEIIELEDGSIIELSFMDFINKDYLDSMDTYTRKMSGTTVLRKYGWDIDARMEDIDALDEADFATHKEYLHEYNRIKQKNTETMYEIKNEIYNRKEFVEMRARLEDIKNKQTDEGIELFKSVGDKILKSLDPKSQAYIRLSKALKNNNYQGVADVVFEEMQSATKAIDDIDSTRLFELMDEFITTPANKTIEIKSKMKYEIKKAIDIEVKKAYEPTKFRLKTKADYDTFRAKVRKELDEAVQAGKITIEDANKDMVRLESILKDMSGIATSKDPQSNLNRFYRIAHSYNVGRLLGQTFFTMPAEAMNVMWDVGMKSFIEAMPSMKSLLRAYKNGNIDDAQAKEIQDSLGMYDEFLSGPRMYEFDHDFDATTNYSGKAGKAVDKIEAWGENFAEFTLMTGGIKPLTAWFQTAHIMGVFKKMRAVAEGGNADIKYKKMIKELGLSKEMEIRVYDNINKNFDNGTMNFDSWEDDVKNVFLMGVKRRTDTLVQMQRLGDKPAWVSEQDYMFKDTFVGKVVMELKQFVITAYVKQLGRALNRKDQYMIGLIASQMTALTLAYIGKQSLNYSGNPEKLKRSLQTENIILGTMELMPQGSVLPMVLNFGSNLVFGEDVLGTSRHNSQATNMISSLAIVDGISKVMEAMSIPSEIVTGEFDNKTLKPVAGLTGVSNSWLSKWLWESTQNK